MKIVRGAAALLGCSAGLLVPTANAVAGLKPEPAPPSAPSLRPDPAPHPQPASRTPTSTSTSTSTSMSSSSSAGTGTSTKSAVPPATATLPTASSPAGALRAIASPAGDQRAVGRHTKHGSQPPPSVREQPRPLPAAVLRRVLGLPASLLGHTGIADIGRATVTRSASGESTLLLLGGLALVLLVLGETTMLAVIGRGVGLGLRLRARPANRDVDRPGHRMPRHGR